MAIMRIDLSNIKIHRCVDRQRNIRLLVRAFVLGGFFASLGLLAFGTGSRAHASEADALRLLGARAARPEAKPTTQKAGQKTSKKTKAKKVLTKSDPKASLAVRAEQELVLGPEERTELVITTPATVRTKVEAVEAPESRRVLEFGLGLQPYRPVGGGRVTGFDSYDLGALGEKPMASIELRWLALSLKARPTLRLGGFFSAGYAQHSVDLKGPTGAAFDRARLHTVKTQGGVAAAIPIGGSSRWSARAQIGLGRLDSVQTSRSPEANQSGSLDFISLGAFAENRVSERVAFFAGYENRAAFEKRDPELGLPRHNFLIGIWGNLQ